MRSEKTHFKLQAEEDRTAHSLIRKLEFWTPHAGTYVQGQSSSKQNGLPFSPQQKK